MPVLHKKVNMFDYGEVRRISQALYQISRELKTMDVMGDIEQFAAAVFMGELKEAITRITDLDGNEVGETAITDYGSFTGLSWIGEEVIFLEFGTGRVGHDNQYAGGAAFMPSGYEAIPHSWSYQSRYTGEYITTSGITGTIAPMYTVYVNADRIAGGMTFRQGIDNIITRVIEKAIR